MNCSTHTDRTGIAVCVNCGSVVCADCVIKSGDNKNVCSTQCAAASMAIDSAIKTIAARVKRSSKANSWVYWSLGAIFGILGAISKPIDLFLATYLLAASVVFIGAGFWYSNIAKKKPPNIPVETLHKRRCRSLCAPRG